MLVELNNAMFMTFKSSDYVIMLLIEYLLVNLCSIPMLCLTVRQHWENHKLRKVYHERRQNLLGLPKWMSWNDHVFPMPQSHNHKIQRVTLAWRRLWEQALITGTWRQQNYGCLIHVFKLPAFFSADMYIIPTSPWHAVHEGRLHFYNVQCLRIYMLVLYNCSTFEKNCSQWQ